MSKRSWKTVAYEIFEGLTVVILVLLFFGLLFFCLNFFFPSGTSLREIVSREELMPFADLSIHGEGELAVERSREKSEKSALLSNIRNVVKAKRAGAIAWSQASVGMPLYHRDAIQTFRRASARITLDEESFLDVEENTLVIVKRIEEDLLLSEKESVLIMVDGRLQGSLKGSAEKSINVEIATPGAVTRVVSADSNVNEAAFTVTVNPDKSSTVTVFEGIAAVSAQNQVVRVEANQGVTVNLGQVPPAPKPLPAAPVLSFPNEGIGFFYRDLPPVIQFSWNKGEEAESYHFVLARDREFNEIVEDTYVSSNTFRHGNLKEGDYHWRVSSRSGWAEGKFGRARMIHVVKDLAPPALRVLVPDGIVEKDTVFLKGETEPGSRVFVQGKEIQTDVGGVFEYGVPLRRGTNVIVVEAMDAAGNVAYRSAYVNSRF